MAIIQTQITGSGGGTAPTFYREFQLVNGVLQPSTTTTHIMDFTGMTDVSVFLLAKAYYQNTAISGAVDMGDLTTVSSNYACEETFRDCTGLTSVDLSSLTTVSGSYSCMSMFRNCTGLLSIDVSSLTTISGDNGCNSMFSNCTGLTSVDLSSLTTVSNSYSCGYMFQACNGLLSADLSSLTTISGSAGCYDMFHNCSALTSVNLSSLTIVTGHMACQYMVRGCTNLTSLSFPAITTTSFGTRTNQFSGLCNTIPNITLHFPSNVQSQIEALSGYSSTTPFGAISGSVLFDLPATVILTGANSVAYERNPKYDTVSALAWRVNGSAVNSTSYYTSTLNDPAVSDTIYSDAACTTAVTTISSIS